VVDTDWTVNTAIPEGNPVGITSSETFSGLASGAITDVSVDLNISGGYNGGLYGYLVLQDANGNTVQEMLLNLVGASTANPFGSSGSGMDVTLSDSGTANGSIHNTSGNPTGTWQPDSVNALDGTFGGLTANGTWTLFLEDQDSGGGTSTLNSWGLDISVASVPEASRTGLLSGVCGLLVVTGVTWHQRRKLQAS
jgi:subtilisin-like proprotein convertase family protein